MKRAISIFAVLSIVLLLSAPLFCDPQVNRTVTLTTGTAVRVATRPTIANSLFIQMRTGGTHIGYVLWSPSDVACSVSDAGQIIAELSPASADGPGGSFSFGASAGADRTGFDVQNFCVAGTTSDTVLISYNVRN